MYNSILDTIGNTPIVELKKMDTGKCRLFAKLEKQNPGGSVKDRIALSMINDVKTTINGKLLERPFVNNYKGLITLSYATNLEKWQFDFTTQFNGKSRLPDQSKMPESLRRPDHTPDYIIFIAQITKKIKCFDVYLGCENLTNFTQKDPITQYLKPYHKHFDTTMVWGPITGRVVYAGIRFAVK